MDPVTIIVTAASAGAAAAGGQLVKSAVKDGYDAFKKKLVRRFGKSTEVVQALESVEKKPDSKGRRETLREELLAAGAAGESDLIAAAQGLIRELLNQGLLAGEKYQAMLTGEGAIAQGPGAVSAGQGGVAIGGDVHGDVRVDGEE